MQTYPVRAGHMSKVDFGMVFDACFERHAKEAEWYTGAFGSMPVIKAKYEGKELVVDTVTDKSILPLVAKGDREAMRVAMDTQQRWNEFLEAVTGYDAKERKKKSEEGAKKAAKAAAEREEKAARERLSAKLAERRGTSPAPPAPAKKAPSKSKKSA